MGAWTLTGRVRVNKSMTVTQMKATIKFTNEFLNSNISTRRGIKKAKQKAIKTLKIRFSSETNEISYAEAEVLTHFFDDKDVNGITNYIKGSDVLAIIEEAKEKNFDYETFSSTMNSYIQYNKGKGNYETILRKIYSKYIFTGSENVEETDLLYGNIGELVNTATTESDLQEVESIISNLIAEGKITSKEFNYLINLINEKRKEL